MIDNKIKTIKFITLIFIFALITNFSYAVSYQIDKERIQCELDDNCYCSSYDDITNGGMQIKMLSNGKYGIPDCAKNNTCYCPENLKK